MTTLRAVLFDFDGTLWDSETAVFGVFRQLYREHGHELTLGMWSAAIGTLGGFDPYASLNQLVGGGFDVEDVRPGQEGSGGRARVPSVRVSRRSCVSSTTRASDGRS
jgi:hypothetical protein